MASKHTIYIVGIAVAFVASIGLGAMIVRYQGQGESYAPSSPKQNAQATSPVTQSSSAGSSTGQETATQKPPSDAFPEIPKQTGALTALDLSLGKLTIGDDMEKVRAILGNPKSSRLNEYGSTVYKFDTMEVVFQQDNKVIALVSESAAATTPRGIHDGSTAKEVFAAYGNNYNQSSYGGLKLYEYNVTSKDGRSCILRFAIRESDAIVDYISIRAV